MTTMAINTTMTMITINDDDNDDHDEDYRNDNNYDDNVNDKDNDNDEENDVSDNDDGDCNNDNEQDSDNNCMMTVTTMLATKMAISIIKVAAPTMVLLMVKLDDLMTLQFDMYPDAVL